VRHRHSSLSTLRLAARLDAIAGQLQSAASMKTVGKTMRQAATGLGKALEENKLEGKSEIPSQDDGQPSQAKGQLPLPQAVPIQSQMSVSPDSQPAPQTHTQDGRNETAWSVVTLSLIAAILAILIKKAWAILFAANQNG